MSPVKSRYAAWINTDTTSVPTNCYFFVDDVEDDWEYTQPFDFIYSRIMTGSMANWPRFFKQSYE